MKKALMVTTTASMIMQFNMPNIHILQELGYDVSVACNFNNGNSVSSRRVEEFISELDQSGIIYHCIDFPRSPFELKRLYSAYRKLKELIWKEKYDLIHCHTPVGGFLTRIVGIRVKWVKDTKIIYTAHGFHFYKGAPLENWLLYFPVEWICSFWTDVLITINEEDYVFAQKHLHAKKTEYVPGVGIDLERFSVSHIDKQQCYIKREEMGIPCNSKIVFSVGELNKNKNHEIVIKALTKVKDKNIHYVIAGIGELGDYLQELAKQQNVDDRVHFIGFRNDIDFFYKMADLYIHPSLREGLPVALMEAIAAKKPVICSNIRGCIDLVGENARFNPDNINEVIEKINIYLRRNNNDEIEKNYEKLKKCDVMNVINDLRNIYDAK